MAKPQPIERGATWEEFLAQDAVLVQAGILPSPPWWRGSLKPWYMHPTALTLVAEVGRGGIKSHTSGKVACAEVVFGHWNVPPGERHYFAFVSVNKGEASQRLLLIESFLRALDVKFDRVGDEINLRDRPLGFKVFAADIGAVSGFRCMGYVIDEGAKIPAEGADPCAELAASLNAMCVTHPRARKMFPSSPFGTVDFHHQLVERGNTRDQLVVHAASWESNPSITKQQTLALEPDHKVWLREYAAIPGGTVNSIFDKGDVHAAFKQRIPEEWGPSWWSTDPSSLSGDGYGCMRGKEVNGTVCICESFEYGQLDFQRMTLGDITADIAKRAKEAGCSCVLGDQRESAGISVLFEQAGIAYQPVVWTNQSIHGGVLLLRRLMKDRKLAICPDDALKNEMTRAKQHLLPTGTVRYQLSGLDRLSCLITWAILRQNTVSLGDGEDKLSRMLRQSIERGEVNKPPDCDYQQSTPSLFSHRTL